MLEVFEDCGRLLFTLSLIRYITGRKLTLFDIRDIARGRYVQVSVADIIANSHAEEAGWLSHRKRMREVRRF